MMQNVMRKKMGVGFTGHWLSVLVHGLGGGGAPPAFLEAERALDHQIGTQVQRAYLRTDFLEQRRELAE